MSLEEIAKQLTKMDESIVLIYAFNGVGKTQLSVTYKKTTKEANKGKHTGVYYNAYSEDLFGWDNDEANDGIDVKLSLLPSSLNQFHSFLYEDEDAIWSKLAPYSPKYRFRLNMHDDLEKGIKSVTFFIEGKEDVPIKISRGEERIFVWCFFLALLEVDGWANEQNAHIFIDDPVSSLDEHNIFITADSIFQLIETNYEKKRIFITTHHIGLLSILDNRLTKGEKSGRYKNLTTTQILRNVSGDLKLQTLNKNFLYHLHLLEILDESRKQNLYTYHFSLLRQLLENVASFIGTGRPGHALTEIGVADIEASMHVINTHSHKNIYYHQTELMSEAEQGFFNEILDKLVVKYSFNF
jgi:hypothetical protein